MNTIKLFLLLLLPTLALGSCSKDKIEEDFILTNTFLSGTSWRGTMVEWGNGQIRKNYEIGFVFYNKNTGSYDIKETGKYTPKEYPFWYRVGATKLEIEDCEGSLVGIWILLEKKGDQLIFEEGAGGEFSHKKRFTLTKNR